MTEQQYLEFLEYLNKPIPTDEEIKEKNRLNTIKRKQREAELIKLEELKERKIREYDKKRAKQINETMRKYAKGKPLFDDQSL